MHEETRSSKEKKQNKIFLIIVIILAVVIVALGIWQAVGGGGAYQAVFLRTGDLYFGKLTRFPSYGLKNVYFVQATGDQENPLSIQRFQSVFWGPEDFLKINKNEVVWTAKVRKESQLAQVLQANPSLLPETSGPSGTSLPQGTLPGIELETEN